MSCTFAPEVAFIWGLIATVAGVAAGLAVWHMIDAVGWRRYPNATMIHNHHRNRWSSAGLLVAIVVVFPTTVIVLSAIARPFICSAFGTYY